MASPEYCISVAGIAGERIFQIKESLHLHQSDASDTHFADKVHTVCTAESDHCKLHQYLKIDEGR